MREDAIVRTAHFGGCLVVTVGQELDVATVRSITRLVADPMVKNVVVNVRDDRPGGIAAVSALRDLGDALASVGGSLHIVGADERLRVLTGASTFVHTDPGEALEAAMAFRASCRGHGEGRHRDQKIQASHEARTGAQPRVPLERA